MSDIKMQELKQPLTLNALCPLQGSTLSLLGKKCGDECNNHDELEFQVKLENQESSYSSQDHQNKPPVQATYMESESCPRIQLICKIMEPASKEKTINDKFQNSKKQRINSNETKNIAKNYGKAIIAFILKNKKIFRQVCKQTSTPYQRIMEEIPEVKKILTTVIGFRRIWTTYKYSQCMRVMSFIFLRKASLPYIFNSKVSNIETHIKYRQRFLDGLCDPLNFDHIKQN